MVHVDTGVAHDEIDVWVCSQCSRIAVSLHRGGQIEMCLYGLSGFDTGVEQSSDCVMGSSLGRMKVREVAILCSRGFGAGREAD